MALGVGFLAAAQQGPLGGIPTWVWLLLVVLVIFVAILVVLREEEEEAQEEAEPAEVAVAEAAEPAPLEPDDLTRIEGIGPRISGLLQGAGIASFAQLAEAEVSQLNEILEGAGLGGLADPTTWPRQAGLAAAGDWDALAALQDELKGGRQA
jgi:predicted flap endonuclease-1-like 5' DNA nuclease